MTLAAVILAGGASRRMGRPKALLAYRGETVLDRLIGLYSRFCTPVIVVLGHAHEAIRAGLTRAAEAQFAINPDPERGQLSSLQCGLALAPPGDVLFTPVDYAGVRAETVEALVRHFEASPAAARVAPSHAGRHGHPVLIRAYVKDALLALPVTATAREVMERYRGATEYLPVDDEGTVSDLDFPADYERLLAREAASRHE